jgi:hypothetical protein
VAQDEYLSLNVEDLDETRARLALVKGRLAAHDVALPPGRLARFERLHEAFAAKTLTPARAADHPRDLIELLEGNRDFHEVALIVEHLLPAAPPADPVMLAKLKHILGGAALPSEDANPLARSTQFELYVAALCARGGLPVKFREPDCIVTAAGVRLGIAAKRAGGPQVHRLFVQATSQLRKAKLDGVVALSFDRLFRPNDERLFSASAEALKPEAPRLLDETLRPYLRTFDRAAAGSRAIALFAFLVVPVAVPKRNQVGRVSASLLRELRPMSKAQRVALTELHERTAQRDSDPV